MSVDIPNPMGINLDILGPVELGRISVDPVTVNPLTASIQGIPTAFSLDIRELPLVDVNLRKVQLGVDPLALSLQPVALAIAITELPPVRVHFPAHFRLGVTLLGKELAAFEWCGEAQMITEPYVPNPAERCSPPRVVREVSPAQVDLGRVAARVDDQPFREASPLVPLEKLDPGEGG